MRWLSARCIFWFKIKHRWLSDRVANHELPAFCAASEIWNSNSYHRLQKWAATALAHYPGPLQSSPSVALAKRIAALGTRMRVCSKFRARACVYFARPTIAIAKIRDHSQSKCSEASLVERRDSGHTGNSTISSLRKFYWRYIANYMSRLHT